MTRCILFWSGFGWCVASVATDTEIAGPFPDLHDAWLEAHQRGMRVVDVMTTRGHVKPKRPELTTTGVA